MKQGTVTIRGVQWQVSIAETIPELTAGLSNIASIPAYTGMLFDMGSDTTINVTTADMLFNLDIAYISPELVVTGVALDVPPGSTDVGLGRYFLEVNAGELAAAGVVEGDGVTIQITQPSIWDTIMSALTAMVLIGGMGMMVKAMK